MRFSTRVCAKMVRAFCVCVGRLSLTCTVSPEELVGMFFKMVEPTESRKSFASLPYIKGVTEPLTRVLKKHDVTVNNNNNNNLLLIVRLLH